MNRSQFLEKTNTIYFDICIIGGGATGAGCALEAQSCGLQTILIEKEDFGAGTSSKSTKLIHGGVRYLEQAVKKLSIDQFKMVRKALKERKTLLSMAPHITRPLQLITPCRNWVSGMYYFIGLKLYDWISGNRNIGSSKLLSKKQAATFIPTLNKSALFNAVLYYDGQLDDQRFNLALIQTAVQKGACCINHCSAVAFEKNGDGKLSSLTVRDNLSDKSYLIKAKQFINATGPFADAVRTMANETLKPRLTVSKGVHILLPGKLMPTQAALLIPETKDGRLVFVIPYGNYLLAGTTDDAVPLTTKEFGPDLNEVRYILEYVNQYLDINATPDMVTAGFGGLRPLITADENATKDLVRDHEVEVDASTGLISIIGGKWTTYRLMAKDTIEAAVENLKPGKDITNGFTENILLVGSQHFNKALLEKAFNDNPQLSPALIKHILAKYGDKSLEIADDITADPAMAVLLVNELPYSIAELKYVIENEMACTVKDVLNRRWGVQLFNWEQTLQLIQPVGKYMANYFNWNEAEKQLYINDYEQEVRAMMKQLKTQA
ncbi:MAG: FAD-dependent oxidoreductase [Bacteroidota bacterium]